jgi:hypothetical protein
MSSAAKRRKQIESAKQAQRKVEETAMSVVPGFSPSKEPADYLEDGKIVGREKKTRKKPKEANKVWLASKKGKERLAAAFQQLRRQKKTAV